jgi:hypothetical protein
MGEKGRISAFGLDAVNRASLRSARTLSTEYIDNTGAGK